ncbi:MAG: hypothetical protein FWF87_01715 [Synergistaceae bacterium]|nr:hypothetical protein [Synergistaceae bacterium]
MLKLFSRSNNRSILVVVGALICLLAFSASAFAHARLILKPLPGWTFNDVNIRLVGNPPTSMNGNTNISTPTFLVTPVSADANEIEYHLADEGTYAYNVYSLAPAAPGETFYDVFKLIYISVDNVDYEEYIRMEVQTGRRTGNGYEPGPSRRTGISSHSTSVSIFTDQIIDKQFDTKNLTDYVQPNTPTLTTSKGLYQVATQEDVINFTKAIVTKNPKAHWFSLGKTPVMDFDLPCVIITNSPIPEGATFEQAAEIIRLNDKVTFFQTGSIHGGEVSAAEGAMATLDEMAGAFGEKILDRVNYVCVPRFNVEGGYFWTRTSIVPTVDMNRDHLRLKAKEVQMVHNAFLEIMPEMELDGHEIGYFTLSRGSATYVARGGRTMYPYTVTGGTTDGEVTPAHNMNNPLREVDDMGMNLFGVNFHAELKRVGLRSDHYMNGGNPANLNQTGGAAFAWGGNNATSRQYYALMGAVSVLCEVRGMGSLLMARRAFTHLTVAKSMLQTAYDNHTVVKDTVARARAKAVEMGKEFKPEVKVYLHQFAPVPAYTGTGTAPTYGTPKYTPFEGARQQFDMQGNVVSAVWKPAALNNASHRDRPRPTAYVLPMDADPAFLDIPGIIESMKANRIEFYEVKIGTTAPLRQYYWISGRGNGSQHEGPDPSYNAQYLVADLRPEANVTLSNGAYVIPLDQVAGPVAVAMFEPDIANTNQYNATIAQFLNDANEALCLASHDVGNSNNYAYYRLEKDDPRKVLPKDGPTEPDKCLPDCIEDLLDCAGCNMGLGLLLAIFVVPFVWKKK